MIEQNSIQKMYFFYSMVWMAITGWSYGLMMGVPFFMIWTTMPLVIWTPIILIIWLLFGRKIIIKIAQWSSPK